MRIEEVIGERIREVREETERTQEQLGQDLAGLLGRPWSRQAVSSAEQGKRQFTAAELVAIAHTLSTTVAQLIRPKLTQHVIELPSGATINRDALVAAVTLPTVSNSRAVEEMRRELLALIDDMTKSSDAQIQALEANDAAFQRLDRLTQLFQPAAAAITVKVVPRQGEGG